MQTKEKKCNGTGRAAGYGCGSLSLFRKYGLCHKCYPSWLFNSEEGKKLVKKAVIKATKQRVQLEEAKRENNETKKIPALLLNTRNAVHKYIRERDKGLPCISCGKPWSNNFHAGHFYKAEIYSSLRFNLDNIHGQCPECNLFKEGNINEYDLRLPFRIGEEMYLKLKKEAINAIKSSFKWDRTSLELIRNHVNILYKELKKSRM